MDLISYLVELLGGVALVFLAVCTVLYLREYREASARARADVPDVLAPARSLRWGAVGAALVIAQVALTTTLLPQFMWILPPLVLVFEMFRRMASAPVGFVDDSGVASSLTWWRLSSRHAIAWDRVGALSAERWGIRVIGEGDEVFVASSTIGSATFACWALARLPEQVIGTTRPALERLARGHLLPAPFFARDRSRVR